MIRITGDDDSKQVDYTAKTANIYCDICGASKKNVPLMALARNMGGAFTLSSDLIGCECKSLTIYPSKADDVMTKTLHKMAGLTKDEPVKP